MAEEAHVRQRRLVNAHRTLEERYEELRRKYEDTVAGAADIQFEASRVDALLGDIQQRDCEIQRLNEECQQLEIEKMVINQSLLSCRRDRFEALDKARAEINTLRRRQNVSAAEEERLKAAIARLEFTTATDRDELARLRPLESQLEDLQKRIQELSGEVNRQQESRESLFLQLNDSRRAREDDKRDFVLKAMAEGDRLRSMDMSVIRRQLIQFGVDRAVVSNLDPLGEASDLPADLPISDIPPHLRHHLPDTAESSSYESGSSSAADAEDDGVVAAGADGSSSVIL